MEKILKFIRKLSLLVPFLIILLSIKEVSAEETNIYFSTGYNRYQFNEFTSSTYNDVFVFNALNNDFKLNSEFTLQKSHFYVVLYDKINDFYILLTIDYSANCELLNFDLNLTTRCFNNNQWINANTQYNWVAILSTEPKLDYLNNLYNQTNASSYNNGIYYLSQNKLKSYTNYLSYLHDNYQNYQVVYISNGYKLFSSGNEYEIFSPIEPEPEPEPEEPESPTSPPYNFINNKYYVPNYQEGNCVEIIDKDTIRVFENENTNNYIDYYINSHYVSKTGQVEVDYTKQCSNLEFTNIRYYGNDFPEILFITLCVIVFTIGFPYILYKRFRKR